MLVCVYFFVNSWYHIICHSPEAERWLSTLSSEGTPVMGSGLRPGPVKPHAAAL